MLITEIKKQIKKPLFWLSLAMMWLFAYCIWHVMYLACIGMHGMEACN